jgi:hypothetical protein
MATREFGGVKVRVKVKVGLGALDRDFGRLSCRRGGSEPQARWTQDGSAANGGI